ncbi:MAG: regulatory protein RecX [Actinomyces sp.]|jgi:recX family|nr:regulatory protein RecX [Actinomyces sp.]
MVRYYDPETTSEEDVRPRTRTKSPAERQALMRQRNAALEGQAAFEAAREVALRQLDVRARSRSELETAITSRGFSSEVADSVIERLTQLGLVDDLAFARTFSRGRFEAGGKTGSALRVDLHRKGISPEIIDTVLSEIGVDEQFERALNLAQKKMRSMPNCDDQVARRRIFSMLGRKGYSPQVCIRVLDAIVEGRDDEY